MKSGVVKAQTRTGSVLVIQMDRADIDAWCDLKIPRDVPWDEYWRLKADDKARRSA
jgi:hypothetical protein